MAAAPRSPPTPVRAGGAGDAAAAAAGARRRHLPGGLPVLLPLPPAWLLRRYRDLLCHMSGGSAEQLLPRPYLPGLIIPASRSAASPL